jgi:oligo-1,6-glucosidase
MVTDPFASSSDYQNIDPKYGTLQDWDRLLKGAHDRGMKLVMDLVMNHTSDEVGAI